MFGAERLPVQRCVGAPEMVSREVSWVGMARQRHRQGCRRLRCPALDAAIWRVLSPLPRTPPRRPSPAIQSRWRSRSHRRTRFTRQVSRATPERWSASPRQPDQSRRACGIRPGIRPTRETAPHGWARLALDPWSHRAVQRRDCRPYAAHRPAAGHHRMIRRVGSGQFSLGDPGRQLRWLSDRRSPIASSASNRLTVRHDAPVLCQGPLSSARRRSWDLPGDGHEKCPVMVMGPALC